MSSDSVMFDDVSGLDAVKRTIQEAVIWPMMRPDIFKGLLAPPKGILLFGPPGTGKTLIGKCIASQTKATFFNISASSLLSKWVGEGEKMVRALFAVARCRQPSVIFIDEVDSLLSRRNEQEHESGRRVKTQFLIELDGAATSSEDRILLVAATNRPQEIDEAARRRFVKRLYVALPEAVSRSNIISVLMKEQNHALSEQDINELGLKTEGFSGADVTNLCKEAAMGPIRKLIDIQSLAENTPLPPITVDDFEAALNYCKPSVCDEDLGIYEQWNAKFGCAHK